MLDYVGDFVSTVEIHGQKILKVDPAALTLLAEQAFIDVAHLLRPAHLQVIGSSWVIPGPIKIGLEIFGAKKKKIVLFV